MSSVSIRRPSMSTTSKLFKALEHLEGWHTLGRVEGILKSAVEIVRLVSDRVGKEVLGLHHAEQVIQILTGHQDC
jgi:hypothetical protein